jgi:hypothetical protein
MSVVPAGTSTARAIGKLEPLLEAYRVTSAEEVNGAADMPHANNVMEEANVGCQRDPDLMEVLLN